MKLIPRNIVKIVITDERTAHAKNFDYDKFNERPFMANTLRAHKAHRTESVGFSFFSRRSVIGHNRGVASINRFAAF